MPRYKVIEYNEYNQAHKCIDQKGCVRLIDLMIDGSFPSTNPLEMIGKTYEAESEYSYVAIAHKVKEVLCEKSI